MILCPECESSNLAYEDESFNHEFGNEVIRFYYCEDCDWQEEASEVESFKGCGAE